MGAYAQMVKLAAAGNVVVCTPFRDEDGRPTVMFMAYPSRARHCGHPRCTAAYLIGATAGLRDMLTRAGHRPV